MRGQRRIVVKGEGGEHREYSIPRYAHVSVQEREFIQAGDALTEGAVNPHDILSILGEKEMQRHLVDKIQEVYRSQGVTINDKHIEVMVRQMMRFVKVVDPGDTDFLLEQQVAALPVPAGERPGDRPPAASPRPPSRCCSASPRRRWQPRRFVSAASFQETTRVLTEAAVSGKVDNLHGLKENVIVGRLIPAGTGAVALPTDRDRAACRRTSAGAPRSRQPLPGDDRGGCGAARGARSNGPLDDS